MHTCLHSRSDHALHSGGILSAVGNTPLVRLSRLYRCVDLEVFAKLEALNPGGSMKDRPAIAILQDADARGLLKYDSVIIESSSGNMGIGLAQACAYYGLRFICVIDPKTTLQNQRLLKAYGAELDMVESMQPEGLDYLAARLDRVKTLAREIPNSFWPNQYANRANAKAHHNTMAEIICALGGPPDVVFCAVSTCGTLRGCAEYVAENHLRTEIIAVDAIGSVIFGGHRSRRMIPGHGAAVTPALFCAGLAHRHVCISDEECIIGCRRLARLEAIVAGGSSGALVMAVDKLKGTLPVRSKCVAILPDRGERYLDSIYNDEWVKRHFGCFDGLPVE
jgi:N-(2-amino-2-carboxyethyl)-L-glutamate synthase